MPINFREFPGKIVGGVYVFPELTYRDARNKTRVWQQYIRLVMGRDVKMAQNWNLSDFKSINLSDKYFDSDYKYPQNVIVQLWTESGIKDQKRSRSSPNYVNKGKNIGKINETSIFTQALINGRSNYLKKKDKIKPPKNKYYPQSLHKYDTKSGVPSKNIVYPAGVQIKVDGVRAVAYRETDKTIMYSRGLKEYPMNREIRRQLEIVFNSIRNKYPNLYFDGELFAPKMHLQDIVGLAKKPKDILKYYIFDCFDPTNPKLTFKQRYAILKKIFHNYNMLSRVLIPREYLVLVECKTLNKMAEDEFYGRVIDEIYDYSEEELRVKWNKKNQKTYTAYIYDSTISKNINKAQLKKYITQTTVLHARRHFYADPIGTIKVKVTPDDFEFAIENVKLNKYEGIVIRNLEAPYEIGKNKEIRTYQVRKRKPYSTAEYAIWDFKEGRGKNKGVLTWILKTADDKIFSADANMDLETRAKMFRNFNRDREKFNKNYKGKLLTVKFFTISKGGIPTQPKVIGIRELK